MAIETPLPPLPLPAAWAESKARHLYWGQHRDEILARIGKPAFVALKDGHLLDFAPEFFDLLERLAERGLWPDAAVDIRWAGPEEVLLV